jgi:hypothetical protein
MSVVFICCGVPVKSKRRLADRNETDYVCVAEWKESHCRLADFAIAARSPALQNGTDFRCAMVTIVETKTMSAPNQGDDPPC